MSLFRRMSLSRSVASENSDRRLKKTRTKRSPWELNPLEPRVYLTFSPAMSGLYPTQEGSTYALYLSNTGNERAVEWTVNWNDGSPNSVFKEQDYGSGRLPNPLRAEHVYPNGPSNFTIAASAKKPNNSTPFSARPFALDASFSPNDHTGRVTTDVYTGGADTAYAMAIQQVPVAGTLVDKIVVAGIFNGVDFAVARYNPDGTLDTSFGPDGGKNRIDFGSGSSTTDKAYALAIQHVGTENRIVVAGSSGTNFAVARLTEVGLLDTTFNTTGRRTDDFGGTDVATSMAIQNVNGADEIVVAGYGSSVQRFVAARYTSEGNLDTNFATGGKLTLDFPSRVNENCQAVVVQPFDNKLVLGGWVSGANNCGQDFALARVNPNGTLDNTFDSDGYVMTDYTACTCSGQVSGVDSDYSLVLEPDGQIIAAGATAIPNSGNSDFAVLRYNTNGSLDSTFGSGGKVKIDFGGSDDYGYAAALQSDGRIVVAGTATWNTGVSSSQDFGIIRLNIDGSPDSTFGSSGKMTIDFAMGTDSARAVKILADGRILTAGYANNNVFALARIQSGNTLRVDDLKPVADAGPDQVVNFGDAVTLKGTFSEPATPDTHTYLWQVKDTANNLVPGATSTAAEFTFTPPATETSHPTGTTYTATFTVTDSSGSSDTDTVYINVNKIAPVLTITGGEHVAEGTQLELQVSANRTSGIDPTNYVWTVTRMNRPGSGGGESPLADGAGDRFVFAPEDDGDYRVTVTVPWGSGSLTAVQAITVSNAAPDILAITEPEHPEQYRAVTVSSTVVDAGGAADPLSYNWTVSRRDDATFQLPPETPGSLSSFRFMPATTADPTPSDPDRYTIVLTAIDDEGASTTASRTVDVFAGSAPNVKYDTNWARISMALYPGRESTASQSDDAGVTIISQPDGKLLVLATSEAPVSDTWRAVSIARFEPDLSVDTTFGDDDPTSSDPAVRMGSTTTRLTFEQTPGVDRSGYGGIHSLKPGIALQEDGKIVLAGSWHATTAIAEMPLPGLTRLNADGSIDTTFGDGGLVIAHFSASTVFPDGQPGRFNAVAIQPVPSEEDPSGFKIVVGGTMDMRFPHRSDPNYPDRADEPDADPAFYFSRFTSSGAADPTFRGGGSFEEPMNSSIADESVTTLVMLANGRFVAGGVTDASDVDGGSGRIAMARFAPDGQLDTGFGSGGKVFPAPTHAGETPALRYNFRELLRAKDEDLLVTGTRVDDFPGSDVFVARYTENGVLDTTFGEDDPNSSDPAVRTGAVLTDGGTYLSGASLRPDGGIVVAYDGMSTSRNYFNVNQYTADGVLDDRFPIPGYSTPGHYEIQFTEFTAGYAEDVVVTDKGVFVCGAIGFMSQFNGLGVGIARLLPFWNSADDLTATVSSDGAVDLRWVDGGVSEDGFGIERSTTADSGYRLIGSVGSDVTSFRDPNAMPNTRYYYRVYAYVGSEQQGDSKANVRTGAGDITYVLLETVPVHVDGTDTQSLSTLLKDGDYLLKATGDFYLGAGVNGFATKRADAEYGRWVPLPQPYGQGQVHYGVEVTQPQDGEVPPPVFGMNRYPYWGAPSYDADHTYTIRYSPDRDGKIVLRYHDDFYGDNLEDHGQLKVAIYKAVPAAPTYLTASPIRTPRGVKLEWRDNARTEQSTLIERSVNGASFEPLLSNGLPVSVPGNQRTYTDSSVDLNTRYTYRVRTHTAVGTSSYDSVYSNEASALVVNRPPQIDEPLQRNAAADYTYSAQVTAWDPESGTSGLSLSMLNFRPEWRPDGIGLTIAPVQGNPGVWQISGSLPAPDPEGTRPQYYLVGVGVTDSDGAGPSRYFRVNLPKPSVLQQPPTISAPTYSTVSPTTLKLTTTGSDPDGNAEGLEYNWSLVRWTAPANSPWDAPSEPSFSENGSAAAKETLVTFGTAGTYTLAVTVTDPQGLTASAKVDVVVSQVLSGIAITPGQFVLSQGGSWDFEAVGEDQFGDPMGLSGPLAWSVYDFNDSLVTDTQVMSVDANGLTTAGPNAKPVVYRVEAKDNTHNFTSSAEVSVLTGANGIPTFATPPTAVVVGPNETDDAMLIALNVLGADDAGEGNLTYTWSSTSAAVTFIGTNGTNSSKSFMATVPKTAPTANYTFNVLVRDAGNQTAIADATLSNFNPNAAPQLTTIAISPTNPTLSVGVQQVFQAQGYDQWGRPFTAGSSTFAWTKDGGSAGTSATYTYTAPAQLGSHAITATSGSVVATITVEVIPAAPPKVALTWPAPAETAWTVKGDTDVKAVITNGGGPALSWTLKAVLADGADPQGGAPEIVLASGTGPVGTDPVGGLVGKIRPTLLASGLYRLVLTATDANGTTSDEQKFQVQGELKLGNLSLPFTDLSVPVAGGQSISVTRVYDSSHASEDGDFGYGWRLDASDSALRTTASRKGDFGQSSAYSLFEGDLVFITLPGGRQQAFRFHPDPKTWNLQDLYYTYEPRFVPVDGSKSTLTVPNGPLDQPFSLIRHRNVLGGGDEYYADTTSGRRGYNPAAAEFGGEYYVTTEDGTQYTINAASAKITSIKDANENTINLANVNSITGPGDIGVTFTRSADGKRIESVADPNGKTIDYTYDPVTFDLIGVTERQLVGGTKAKTTYVYADRLMIPYSGASSTTVYGLIRDEADKVWNGTDFVLWNDANLSSYATTLDSISDGSGAKEWYSEPVPSGIAVGKTLKVTYKLRAGASPALSDATLGTETKEWNKPQEHFLTAIIDPRGVRTLAASYDAAGQLTKFRDVSGRSAPFAGGGFDGKTAEKTVTDLAGNETEFKYNERGEVVREIKAIMNADRSTVAKYVVTVRRITFGSLAAEGLENVASSSSEAVPFEIPGPDTAGLRHKSTEELEQLGYIVWASESNFNSEKRVLESTTTSGTPATGGFPAAPSLTTNYADFVMGVPKNVTDPYANLTQSGINATTGRMDWSINAAGERMEYVYNGQGDLTEVYRAPGGNREASPITHNEYYDATGKFRLHTTTDAAGLTTEYTYYPDGKVDEVKRAWTDTTGPHTVRDSKTNYDDPGRVTTVYDADNNYTENVYDVLGRVSDSYDKYRRRTHYDFDVKGNLIRTLNPDGTETRTAYDEMGRAVWTTDRYASSSTIVGQPGTITNDNTTKALATFNDHDDLGRVTATVRYADVLITLSEDAGVGLPAGHGILLTSAPMAGYREVSRTSTEYDAAGRAKAQVNADGLRTETTYYNDGRVKSVQPITVPATPATIYEYQRVQDPLDTNHFIRQDVVKDARANSTTTEYDKLDRPTETSFADGSFITTSYDPYGDIAHKTEQRKVGETAITTDYVYDKSGRLVNVVMPDPDGPGVENPLGPATWTYRYDANGNQTAIVDPRSGVHSPDWNPTTAVIETAFIYDVQNRRTSRTLPDGGQSETSSYEDGVADTDNVAEALPDPGFGRLLVHTDFMGQSTRYEYDDSATGGGRVKAEWRYNANDNPFRLAAAEKTTYAYDALGRLSSVTEWKDPVRSTSTSGGSDGTRLRTTMYRYDPVTGGLTDKLTYGQNVDPAVVDAIPVTALHYAYDQTTGQHTETWTNAYVEPIAGQHVNPDADRTAVMYGYDEQGRLETVSMNRRDGVALTVPEVTVYGYDDVSNLKIVTLPNNLVTMYDYDELNRLFRENIDKVVSGTSTPYAQYYYALTSDGQRDWVDETIYAAAGGTGAAVRTDWTYDAWNRLIDEVNSTRGQSGFFSAHYTYDPVGNRLLKGLDADTTVGYETITDYRYGDIDGQSQLSVVSGNDRLRWEIVKVNGPEQYRVEYRYDANGFTTDKIRTGTLPGTTYYKPDLRGRLWQVSTNGDLPRAPELQYTYDSDGNLVQRQEGTDGTFTKTSDYLVDAGNPTGYAQVLEELLSNAGAATRTTYTLGSDIVSQSAKPATGSAAISHLLYDGHGSTRMLANNLASVIEQYSYDGFGNASANNPSSPSTNLLYSGELWDPTLGQQYLRARYYDPKVGRFTSFDDFQGERGDPLSLHKYLYAGADPVMNSDSNGHEFNIAGVLTTATNMARIGLGIGFGVSGAWNVAMAGMDMQRAYAATTEGSGHATQEIIGNIALFVLHAYTGLKNIQTGVWLLTGAGAPPIPPGSLGVIRAAVAGAGENPVAIGATIIAISPAVARILANAAGVYLGTNTFLSSGLPSSSTDLEDHHLLPNQFAQRFRKAGLEPEDFKIHLAKARHRLKPDGIHTGRFEESWNGQWEKFFEQKPNAGAEEILEQLATMRKDFGI